MINKKIAKQSLNRKVEEYEKYRKFKDKEEADNTYKTLEAQIKLAKEVNLINTAMTMEYLSRIKKKYIKTLQSEQFKEYRNQVLNFNDDFITDKERLYLMQQQEKKNIEQSMKEWEKEIDKKTSSSSGNNTSERAEIAKDKENEREKEQEEQI